LTPAQISCTLCQFGIFLKKVVGTNMISFGFCVCLFVLIAKIALDRFSHLDGRPIGISISLIIIILFGWSAKFLPQFDVFLIEGLKFQLELLQVGMVGFALETL
jgi:hypothetical protein